MDSKAKLLGHSIHQMLIVFPLGLLATAVVFDVVYLVGEAPVFAELTYWLIISGLVGGVIAAPFGLIDWLAIPQGTRAKRVGAAHGIGNVIVLLLFLGSVMLRADRPADASAFAHALSFAGVALSLVTAWLGGELVARLGIGVHDIAHIDAPSSLHTPAHGTAARRDTARAS